MSGTQLAQSAPIGGGRSRAAGSAGSIRRKRIGSALVITAFILLIVILYIYPLLYLVNVSLKTSAEFMLDPTGITKSLRFQNYINVVVNNNFSDQRLNTGLYALTRQWYVVAGSSTGSLTELAVVLPSNSAGTEEKSLSSSSCHW